MEKINKVNDIFLNKLEKKKDKLLLWEVAEHIDTKTYESMIIKTKRLLESRDDIYSKKEKIIISLTLVTYTIREYQGTGFWENFSKKLGFSGVKYREKTYSTFKSFCLENNLYFHKTEHKNAYVTSLEVHSIITDYKMDEIISFLENIYLKYLNRKYEVKKVEQVISQYKSSFKEYMELYSQSPDIELPRYEYSIPNAFKIATIEHYSQIKEILKEMIYFLDRKYKEEKEYIYNKNRFTVAVGKFKKFRIKNIENIEPNIKKEGSRYTLYIPSELIEEKYKNEKVYIEVFSDGKLLLKKSEIGIKKDSTISRTEEVKRSLSCKNNISYKIQTSERVLFDRKVY